MSYRFGNRKQMNLFPKSIEDYVAADHPVRVFDAFVEALDFKELKITLDENQVGNASYDPKAMLKLLVYGYSYGIRSSRKLERASHNNLSFIWIMGGLKPDHKTIANFRRNNLKAIKKVLKECARLCLKLELIEGNTLFTDGTKMRSAAAIKNTWDKKKCERYLKKIDKHIDFILSQCEAIDSEEESNPSLVHMNEELQKSKDLKEKVKGIMETLAQEKKEFINTVDPECTRINSVHGSHAGYNAQIVVDEKNGLIVNIDVVSENNDINQFAEQINQANETLGKKCTTACADSGYANTDELKKIDDQKIKVVVPSQRQASRKQPKEFDKVNFKYDSEKDCYICPVGQKLNYSHNDKKKKSKVYKISKKEICFDCPHYGVCTSSKSGRTIHRLLNEETRLEFEAQYKEPASQEIYKLRKQKVELPFGHIKRNLKARSFLLRGLDGANAEASLLTTCFNISRMITLVGVSALIQKLLN